MTTMRFARPLVAAGLLLIPSLAPAALEIKAKAGKTEPNKEEEIRVIRIDQTKTCGPGKIDAKPDPLPAGAEDARQFQLTGSRLTLAGTATTALLEKTP